MSVPVPPGIPQVGVPLPPGMAASQTSVGVSEEAIASNLSRNWPTYNNQPVQEAIDMWNAIVTRALLPADDPNNLRVNPIEVRGKPWRIPWRGFDRFSNEKRLRIINRTRTLIQRRTAFQQGIRLEEWNIRGRQRLVEVVRHPPGTPVVRDPVTGRIIAQPGGIITYQVIADVGEFQPV